MRTTPEPRLAVGGDGVVLVGWATAGRVEVVSRRADGTWGQAERVSPVGVPSDEADLAVAADGTALAVWRERRDGRVERTVLRLPDGQVAGVIRRRVGGSHVLVGRRREASGAWQPPQVLSAAAGNARDLERSRVVATPDGGFLVAWVRGDRPETRTVAPDGGLGDVRALEPGPGRSRAPSLAASSSGEVVLGWSARRDARTAAGWPPPTHSVLVARGDRDGWEDPVVIAEGLLQAPQPVVAAGPQAGQAAVGYVTTAAGAPSGVAAARAQGGAWEAPRRLSSPRRSAFGPAVAIDGDGTTVAVWSVGAGTQTTTASAGGAWGPVRTSRGALVTQYTRSAPGVVGDGDGRLLAAAGAQPLTVRDWPRGGPFGPAETVAASTGWQDGFAGLAADGSGAAAVAVLGFGRTPQTGRGWSVRVAVRTAVAGGGG
ncbi:MAG: hypothetical protein AB7V62_02235 [Thermoleophilia bacterium]